MASESDLSEQKLESFLKHFSAKWNVEQVTADFTKAVESKKRSMEGVYEAMKVVNENQAKKLCDHLLDEKRIAQKYLRAHLRALALHAGRAYGINITANDVSSSAIHIIMDSEDDAHGGGDSDGEDDDGEPRRNQPNEGSGLDGAYWNQASRRTMTD